MSDGFFLTSDMPVVHVGNKDEKGKAINISFFFPVTPHLAFVFPSKESKTRAITSRELDFYNSITKNNAYRFIFDYK